MNKSLLICCMIATGLFVTACVKKESPKEHEQDGYTTTQEEQTQPPTEFQQLESIEPTAPTPHTSPEVEREFTPNTTTEIYREPSSNYNTSQDQTTASTVEDQKPTVDQQTPTKDFRPKPTKATKQTQDTVTQSNTSSNAKNTEEDAVAAAMAAAAPAL